MKKLRNKRAGNRVSNKTWKGILLEAGQSRGAETERRQGNKTGYQQRTASLGRARQGD